MAGRYADGVAGRTPGARNRGHCLLAAPGHSGAVIAYTSLSAQPPSKLATSWNTPSRRKPSLRRIQAEPELAAVMLARMWCSPGPSNPRSSIAVDAFDGEAPSPHLGRELVADLALRVHCACPARPHLADHARSRGALRQGPATPRPAPVPTSTVAVYEAEGAERPGVTAV
jgi:hypothetical protein